MLDLKHRIIRNTALPFISNASPLDDRLRFIAGSENILTSNRGYLERRPGFQTYTTDDSVGPLRRFFTWRRWAADFFVMAQFEVAGPLVQVFKVKVGTDTNFAGIFTGTTQENFDFAVSNNHVFFCNGTDMKKYDGTTVTNWGITAPSSAVSTSLGGTGLTAVAGYKYVICWENSGTGHISSPSPIMASRVKPTNQTVTISGNTTSDGQVDKVRIYRTTDGGTKYFEHPSSPIAYGTWTASGFADSSADSALGTNEAPAQNQNNRPTASKGVQFYAGRLWTFAGDKVYFSNLEEAKRNHGVPQEAFSADNFYPFGAEVTGLSVTQDALLVHAPPAIYRITGDTRDTFSRDVLSNHAGARNRAAIFSTGRVSAWLDFSNTVRITDGLSVQEISFPIRDQLTTITHSSAAIAIHDDGINHWLAMMDGGGSKLWVFDQDTNQWMPPWSITGMEAIYSGEVAAGTSYLFLGRNGKPLRMNPANWQDEGAAYTATGQLGLLDIVANGKPEDLGSVAYVGVERNSVANSAVGILTDEDPSTGSYADITANITESPQRTQGTNLVEKQYVAEGPPARRVSAKIQWSAANSNFKTYSLDLAYRETVR